METCMKKMKADSPRTGRLAFLPTPKSREYFEQLGDRLTEERGLEIHVTQREIFDRMVDYAREGEGVLKARAEPNRRGTSNGNS